MALTKDRNTPRRDGMQFNDPVAANAKIFAGSLVCLDASGNAVPGALSTTIAARGIAITCQSSHYRPPFPSKTMPFCNHPRKCPLPGK